MGLTIIPSHCPVGVKILEISASPPVHALRIVEPHNRANLIVKKVDVIECRNSGNDGLFGHLSALIFLAANPLGGTFAEDGATVLIPEQEKSSRPGFAPLLFLDRGLCIGDSRSR